MIDGFSGRHALPGEESSRVHLPPSRARYTPYYEWCHGGFGSRERVMSSNPVEGITAIFFSSLLLFRTRVSNSASKALFSKLSFKVQIWTGSWSRRNLCRFFRPKLWTSSDKRGGGGKETTKNLSASQVFFQQSTTSFDLETLMVSQWLVCHTLVRATWVRIYRSTDKIVNLKRLQVQSQEFWSNYRSLNLISKEN